VALLAALFGAAACETLPEAPRYLDRPVALAAGGLDYRIGPGDMLEVIVWQDENLSVEVPVRPDGRVSLPLVEDLVAAGKTPTAFAREVEQRLAEFVQDPTVTVVVSDFVGALPTHVRVVGEAVQPRSIPYLAHMTVLDAVIAAGGLTEFADANRTTLVRTVEGEAVRYRVRLGDLMRDGDVAADVALLPGDVVIVPETMF
jgi:polysaccharide export outer membrane protein